MGNILCSCGNNSARVFTKEEIIMIIKIQSMIRVRISKNIVKSLKPAQMFRKY